MSEKLKSLTVIVLVVVAINVIVSLAVYGQSLGEVVLESLLVLLIAVVVLGTISYVRARKARRH